MNVPDMIVSLFRMVRRVIKGSKEENSNSIDDPSLFDKNNTELDEVKNTLKQVENRLTRDEIEINAGKLLEPGRKTSKISVI